MRGSILIGSSRRSSPWKASILAASKRNLLVLAAASLALVAQSAVGAAKHAAVRVQVLGRGQADGILIRTPNEHWVVIDAGGDGLQAKWMAERLGIDEVDLTIVSHRHRDHYGGIAAMLRRLTVRRFVMNLSDCPIRSTDDRIRKLVYEKGIPAQSLGSDSIDVDGVRFLIFSPDPVDNRCPEDENNNSIVVRMEYGDFSMLFTGDAETEQRVWLMEQFPNLLHVDVLKASHHGSRNGSDGSANGQSWIGHVAPDDVIVSVGANNRFGHPHPEAIGEYAGEVGDNIHCTSEHGTIHV